MKRLVCMIIFSWLAFFPEWPYAIGGWEPTNEIFTYQGRLYDNGKPLNNEVDLIIWLRGGPDPNTAEYVGVVHLDDHPVTDGYLTLRLNFEQRTEIDMPDLFEGSDRWLEFWMRPGDSDPNDRFEELTPLIKLEATPFAHAAYRLKTPAVLKSETAEPTLMLANTGDGATVYFEDEAGIIQYSSDATTQVANDLQRDVGGSFTSIIGIDQTKIINRDSTVQIVRNAATTVGANNTTDIGGNNTTTIGISENHTVSLNSGTTIGGNRTESIGSNSTINIGTDSSTSAGADMTITAGKNMQLVAGKTLKLESGDPVQLQDNVFITHDPNERLIMNGAFSIQSQVQIPLATSGYGKVFVSSSDNKLYYIDSGGVVYDLTAMTNQRVSFSVKRLASYTWPTSSGFATVDFTSGTTIWDNTGEGFSSKSGTFVAPVNGVYTFHAAIFFTNTAKDDVLGAAITINGRRYRGDMKTATTTSESVRANVTVYMKAGYEATLEGYVSAASAPTVYGVTSTTDAFTHFNGGRVD